MSPIGEIRELATGLWVVNGPTVSFYGLPYPTRMTLVRNPTGALIAHSPVALEQAGFAGIDALGPVAFLLAPNKIHHLSLDKWVARYPGAALWGTAALIEKRRDLAFAGAFEEHVDGPWSDCLEHALVKGSKVMEEAVFFHRESRTLIVADMVENFDPRAVAWWFRIIARLVGILAPNGGMPRDWRATFRDKQALRRSLRMILAWSPERLIMSHGLIIETGATAFLKRAFAWAGDID